MQMLPGGIDVFYIDESHDQNTYVATALALPMLRPVDSGWQISWQHYFDATKIWRKTAIAASLRIPMSKELHGEKFASGRGNFFRGRYNFSKAKAGGVYRQIVKKPNMRNFWPTYKPGGGANRKPRYIGLSSHG